MLKRVIAKYKNSKSLIRYFFLTYVDKIISFALPLSILFIIKDKSLYTLVEVAFSYATLCMVIIELGVSNYLFYGYKKAVDKERFVADTQLYFKFLLLIYCLLSLVLFFGIHFYDKTLVMLFVLISIRTLFTLFINFYSNIYRLKDNPSMIYLTSILVNTCSVVLVMLAHFFTWGHTLLYFFIPSLVLITWVSIKFALVELRKFDFSGFRTFLMHSLKFSWPIILNVLAMSYVNNYAKIYAYGHLSQQETVQISYIMRIGLVVQLTHSAFSSFFSKTLFMDTEHKFNFKIFKQYNLVLLFSACLVMVAVFLTNYFFGDQIQIALTTSTFLLLLYIILWCYIGYLEIYFGVMNANRKILYYSIVSSLIYTILLMIFKNIDLLKLSLCMVISAVINLSFVVVGLNKMRVFSLKSQA